MLSLAACGTKAEKPEMELPVELDAENSYGEPVKVEGRLVIEPLPAGKRFQGTWVVLDDGTRYVLSYRPEPAYYAFVDRRVVVEGRPYRPAEHVQSYGADHLELDSMVLAAGQVAIEPAPQELPAPPFAETAEQLTGRAGLWVQLSGPFSRATLEEGDTFLATNAVELGDGTRVEVEVVAHQVEGIEEGQLVTVVGSVQAPAGHGGAHRLHNVRAVCPGKLNLCGGQTHGSK